MMKRIQSALTNPTFLSMIGLIFLSAVIWFAGPAVKFGDSNSAPLGSATARLIGIIAVLLIWGVNNLRVQRRETKSNEALAADLQKASSSVDGSCTVSGQAKEEVHQINQRFSDALTTLNKMTFRSKGRRQALYELPWYIIIGPPGSGKTTALVNSGLEFPLQDQYGKGALQGVGGTRNCDWWFTNDAVLIDTAGRYTTQDSHRVVDSSAWEGFLLLLKRHRKRRPINGAIIAISLHDLMLQSEDERALQARTIRARLDELSEKLEIRFPVYLMFTKADLIAGFNEFFQDLGKEERDQVWGVSLPDVADQSISPDFERLQTEMRTLVDRLYDRVLARMHQEREHRRCAAINGFPQQMENMFALVDSFVKQAFVANRYARQPYLRGVYLSSGTQDGTPIDRMMTAVSSNFGFSGNSPQSENRQGKSFFITRLFNEVIFPESELAGANARYERFIRWSRRAIYGGLATVSVLVLTVWTGSAVQHRALMQEVVGLVGTFQNKTQRVSLTDQRLESVLPSLTALAEASRVYDQQAMPWLTGLGLHDGSVDRRADEAYQTELSMSFRPRLLKAIEDVLIAGDGDGDLYNSFRVYMMFNRVDYMDKALVKEWFHNQWRTASNLSNADRETLSQHLDAMLLSDLKPSVLNDQVVRQTRAAILRLPVAQRVYKRMKTQAENYQTVDVMSFFAPSVGQRYRLNELTVAEMTIPAMFTRQGYRQLDFSSTSPVIADLSNDNWMMSDTEVIEPAYSQHDLEAIAEDVEALYMADYIGTWSRIYEGLDVAAFGGLREASEALAAFADPMYSPIRNVLEVGVANTQLTPPIAEGLAEHTEGKAGRVGKVGSVANWAAGRVQGTPVDKRFSELHLLLHESSRAPAPIEGILTRVKQLEEYVREITLSPDPAKTAFTIAKARYTTGESNPITALRSFATTLPNEPVGRWLSSLADETWRVVLVNAHQHINSEWNAQVYTVYGRALAGRYPFVRAADSEVALYDFSAFFKPQGTLDRFYKEYLEPFIDTRGNWSNKVVDRYTPGLSTSALSQLQQAMQIQQAFFKGNSESPSIDIELRPHSMDKQDARFVLDLGAQRISYNHGPKFWSSVNWSGAVADQRIRMVFEDVGGGTRDRMYTGNWTWFRLMDDAKLSKTSQANVYLISFETGQDGDRRVVYEGRSRSVDNPLDASLLSSFKCPETI